MSKREEFYVLIRDEIAFSLNWVEHGEKGVYNTYANPTGPQKGDRVFKVRQVVTEVPSATKAAVKKSSKKEK